MWKRSVEQAVLWHLLVLVSLILELANLYHSVISYGKHSKEASVTKREGYTRKVVAVNHLMLYM